MSEITTNEIVPAVKATQVHKAFGNLHVLKGIDMTVMPGTVTVILGPSGSGKSTFLRKWPNSVPNWAWCSSASTCSRT